MMDSQISKCREPRPENIKEEEFQKWEPEDVETEETVPTTQTNGNQYWSVDDMFKANKKLCSESDFASDLSQYQTTTVNATAEERERANEIARQIENDSLSRHNARLENDDEERNLDSKTHFEETVSQPSANNVTSWRSQPNRSVNNANNLSGGARIVYRGDRNNERGDSSGYRDRGNRGGYKPTHQQQRSTSASTTNVVTTTSISTALTSPTTSATSAKSGEAAAAPAPLQPAPIPANTVPTVAAITPGVQSVSAPNVTLVKEVTPPPALLPHPSQQLPPSSLQQRPLATNMPAAPPVSAPSKFKFNPDAPVFIPAAVKKEMRATLSPPVTPITSATNYGGAMNNNGSGGEMASIYMVGTTTGVAPAMPGMPPQGIPMQFVPIQTYPPPTNFMYNVVPGGVGSQQVMVSSGMIVQNHQPTMFQSQQQQPTSMMQPPGSQAYPPPTNFVYKPMPPGGVPPHVIASSGPSGGVIIPNHQQTAAFQQQQQAQQPQPQLIQQTNPQGYPPRSLVYASMLPGQPQVIFSSGHAPNMIQVQSVQPGVYQQQPPPMIQPQVNAPVRKSGLYGGYSEDGR